MSWLFSTDLITAVQSALGLGLAWLFIFFTFLGEDIFYIGLIATVYWCFNKRDGITIAYFMLFGFYINYFFKMYFSMDRPPDAYRVINQGDISHGFPSGHSQSAAAFWTWAALKTKLKIMYILSPILIFMVGFSRIYLGVHYPGDVIGGFVIGMIFVFLVYLTYPRITALMDKLSGSVRPLVVPVLALVLLALSLIIFPDTTRDDPAVVCGALFGFSVGLAFESRFVRFTVDKLDNNKRTARLIIGLIIVGIIYVGLSPILPSANVFARFCRYVLVTFAAAFIVPLAFSSLEKRK